MTESLNTHQFYLKTKSFQEEASLSALTEAERFLAEGKPNLKVHVLSRSICKKAFEIFKKELKQTFPSDIYNELMELTFLSRETFFFVDLKERVIKILTQSKTPT